MKPCCEAHRDPRSAIAIYQSGMSTRITFEWAQCLEMVRLGPICAAQFVGFRTAGRHDVARASVCAQRPLDPNTCSGGAWVRVGGVWEIERGEDAVEGAGVSRESCRGVTEGPAARVQGLAGTQFRLHVGDTPGVMSNVDTNHISIGGGSVLGNFVETVTMNQTNTFTRPRLPTTPGIPRTPICHCCPCPFA